MAIGQFGIVKVPNKKDRLIGDSSVSGANVSSVIDYKVHLTCLHDLGAVIDLHNIPG